MKQVLHVLLIALFLVGCGDGLAQLERQITRLEWFTSINRVGDDRDVWLVQLTLGDTEKVALIFGFLDDLSFCQEIADMYMSRYPSTKYVCMAAN